MPEKYAHISFDDVFSSLRWLVTNRPPSVFDMDFYGTLRDWHERFGAVFSLYVFDSDDFFSLSEIPQQYWQDFSKAAKWLKFGFHAGHKNTDVMHTTSKDFEKSFATCVNHIKAFASPQGVCYRLRLHSWSANSKQIDILRRNGINSLFCRDNDGLSYDLLPKEEKQMRASGYFEKNGIVYRPTDLRYDNCADISALLLPLISNTQKEIVLFGHERFFGDSVKQVEKSIVLLKENGYRFLAE